MRDNSKGSELDPATITFSEGVGKHHYVISSFNAVVFKLQDHLLK